MAYNQQLSTDRDFESAIARQIRIRVFEDDQMVDAGAIVVRFDDTTVVVQSSVSDLAYRARERCAFFEMRPR
ncbi:hypothetical protein IDH44_16195 [Paenibacillus sp. IB182496]|uniref:Uncharacterized protein n=1 Tax=Paenibacillus sabuli TaxID=2772509 RepID=A0A927GSM9_9BACL|nr:hypothetical protein [Paenibacillus sabuli]MBD2846738.1 hypothetical protein [Paenibacillus sabuli]